MIEIELLPEICPLYDLPAGNSNKELYLQIIRNLLQQILPAPWGEIKQDFHELLPLLTSSSCDEAPGNYSFFVLTRNRPNSFKFFFDMIGNWLVPGKRLNLVLTSAADFRILELGSGSYTICEVMVHVNSQEELEEIQRNFPLIETEIKLGMQSSYYARRIMEVKGLSADAKTAMIQEHITYLIHRLPRYFDYDILTEMQHLLVLCRDDFKASRDHNHLSRIISIQYLFRRNLREAVKSSPEKRHINLKLFRTKAGAKMILGVVVGLNFLRDKEVFEKRHLLNAIQHLVPAAQPIENSFFNNRRGTEHISTVYLELEKTDGSTFTNEEMALLRRELKKDLRDRIEHLMPLVFMPRNEEEIMRNILSLSSQIKYVRDIPQVFITFDEQTHTNLFFTVILVRLVKPGEKSIQELFKQEGSQLEYIHDWCKAVGFLRRKHAKEATVFRVKFSKEQFLRRDHSIDLYKARQTVCLELLKAIGEFRDYNGGMISKQNEVLCEVKRILGQEGKYKELLLDNFFYSLAPVIMRTLLEPEVLCTIFLMLLESIEEGGLGGEGYKIMTKHDKQFVYLLIKLDNKSLKDEVTRTILKFHLHSSELANGYVNVYGMHYLGYIYRCDHPYKQHQFIQMIEGSLNADPKKLTIKTLSPTATQQ